MRSTEKLLTAKTGIYGDVQITVLPDGKFFSLIKSADYVASFDIALIKVTGIPLSTYHFKGNPFDYGRLQAVPNPNDASADFSVFRPSDTTWYLNPIYPDFRFGLADDIPVAADYLGALTTDLAVLRPSNATWYFSDNFYNSTTVFSAVQWGQTGDIPAPADFDGDGKTDIAVWRPSTQVWYILRSSDNGFTAIQWGLSTDYAVPADYDDDLKTDIAIWRPSNGRWYVLKSSDNTLLVGTWGLNGDVIPQCRQ